MNRLLNALYPLPLLAGLSGIAGAAVAASRHHPVALAMTLLIAAFFALGVTELRAFRRASAASAQSRARFAAPAWRPTPMSLASTCDSPMASAHPSQPPRRCATGAAGVGATPHCSSSRARGSASGGCGRAGVTGVGRKAKRARF